MAILVRASFQMRAFEDRFITLGLPYRVIGGPRFYERQEIRDALAYFKVAASPDNDLAFERIINMPKRGIGDTSVKRMHQHARASGASLYRAAEALALTDELTAQDQNALARLLAVVRALAVACSTACPIPSWPRSSSMSRATRDVAERQAAPRRKAASKT